MENSNITVGLSRSLESFITGIADVEKYIGRDFLFHDATVYPVGIGQMQNFQFHGAKLVIAKNLMSISESVIIVIAWLHGTKETAFFARTWQSQLFLSKFMSCQIIAVESRIFAA